jgi:predicted metal-dependent phosphoesterase TrpH
MDEKIVTLHPEGKRGVHISRAKYDVMKDAIVAVLKAEPGLTHDQLTHAVEARLEGRFDGSIAWYMESTKLDLEARRVIERVPGEKRAVYRVKKG